MQRNATHSSVRWTGTVSHVMSRANLKLHSVLETLCFAACACERDEQESENNRWLLQFFRYRYSARKYG